MKKYNKYLFELIVVAISLVYILPFWMVVINSLKPRNEANFYGLGLPSVWRFDNYISVINEGKIPRAFFNGLFVASIVVILTVIISSMASFYISRANTRLANWSYYYFISGIFIPIAMIPTYLILKLSHMYNTYQGIIIIFLSYTVPLSVFLYTGFIKSVPRQMDEAAVIDGCGTLRMFFQIILPLLRPATITVIVVNFLGAWNDTFTWLFFVNVEKYGMSLMIYMFYGLYLLNWNYVFADVVITIMPVIILYLVAQKYLIQGLTAGAVKG